MPDQDRGVREVTTLPLELLGIRTPKGTLVHLYDIEDDRKSTLCGRVIGVNPRYLGLGGLGPQVSADLADCRNCLRLAAATD